MKRATGLRDICGIIILLGFLLAGSFAVSASAESEALTQIKQDGKIRLGMYLAFEGLSFKSQGELTGLEVELAKLLSEELSKDFGKPIEAEIVNQEWSQIIQVLRDGKYHAVFSALIPSSMYDSYKVRYSASYLDTGPVICSQEADGKPAKDVSMEPGSLKDKRVVVINDPAVRRAMRRAGVFVPADQGKTDSASSFAESETLAEMKKAGKEVPLIPVKEILQLDDMPSIYKMIANGEVDAGVIDLGIIWWVANDSDRWSKKIHAFSKPVGPYIYCAVTREEDADLGDALDKAIERMKANPKYMEICKKWHGSQVFSWGLKAADFTN